MTIHNDSPGKLPPALCRGLFGLVCAVILVLCGRHAWADAALVDGFDFAPAVGTTNYSGYCWGSTNWAIYGNSTASLSIYGQDLTYPGLLPISVTHNSLLRAIGNNSSAKTVARPLASTYSSGTVYWSFLMNVSNVLAGGVYTIAALEAAPGSVGTNTATDPVDIWYKSAAPAFNLGVSVTGGSVVYSGGALPVALATNVTHLVVVKLDYTAKTATLWVDPTPGGTESGGDATAAAATLGSVSAMGFSCTKAAASQQPGIWYDSVRQDTTYAAVTPGVITCSNPTINTQPNSQTSCAGGTAAFTVATTNSNPAYQWQIRTNGGVAFASIGNATNATYATAVLAPADNGSQYQCVVSVPGGCSTTSSVATNTVNTPVSIGAQPVAANTCSSGMAQFSVAAVGTGLAYQWEVSTNGGTNFDAVANGGAYTNATTATLGIVQPSPGFSSNLYFCVLTGICGATNTGTNQLTVVASTTPAVSIAASPGTTNCAGTLVTFTATPVNGGPAPVYQWKKNGLAVGSTNSLYTDSSLTNGDQITVVMTSSDPCASVLSTNGNTLTMAVNALNQPSVGVTANQTFPICSGLPVVFTAAPTNGGGAPVYQWFTNSVAVAGATGLNYTNSVLASNEVVSFVLTPSADICPSVTTVSNGLTAGVNPTLTPAVTISASPAGGTCLGTPVVFTANPVNGGGSPGFVWTTNGVTDPGSTNASYTNLNLANGETVGVVLTSSLSVCLTSSTASATVTNVVNTFGIGGGGTALINEPFASSATPAGWTLGTGWAIANTTPMVYTGGSGTYYAGVTTAATGYLVTPTVNASADTGLQLSFAANHNSTTTAGSIVVDASKDGGTSWTTVETIAYTNIAVSTAATVETVSLGSAFDNQPSVTLRFSTPGLTGTTIRMRIDDVMLTGTGAPAANVASITTALTTNGTVAVTASAGGTNYLWSGPGGFTTNTPSNTIAVAVSGDYLVTVTDVHGCAYATNQIVTVPALPNLTNTLITASVPATNVGSLVVITVTERDDHNNVLTNAGYAPVLATTRGTLDDDVTNVGNGVWTATLHSDDIGYANVTGKVLGSAITGGVSVYFAGPAPLFNASPGFFPGTYSFGFSGTASQSFSVWSSTNLALPLAQWTLETDLATGNQTMYETTYTGQPSAYSFTVQPPASGAVYYRIRSP